MFLVEPGIQKGVVFILVEMLHQLKSSFFMFLPFTGLSTSQIVHDFEVNSVFVDFAFETTQQIRTYIYIYTGSILTISCKKYIFSGRNHII